MKRISTLLLFFSCNQKKDNCTKAAKNTMETYSTFEKASHLLPQFDKKKFDTLHSWDFGWELLGPINIATDQENSEDELSKRLSPGQKALYFLWYLDAQVSNGGFIQFYFNGYRKYLELIKSGLMLIGDNKVLELVNKADQEYLLHQSEFEKYRTLRDWSPLYKNLTKFDELDGWYYQSHDHMMELLEKYAPCKSARVCKTAVVMTRTALNKSFPSCGLTNKD
jgi:Domain of unknown function (DUF4375)